MYYQVSKKKNIRVDIEGESQGRKKGYHYKERLKQKIETKFDE
jgi:hypothetical protein